MKTIRELHNEAMELADEADRARQTGEEEKARKLYEKALESETEAMRRSDPGRNRLGWSIMARSSAWLAFLSGQRRMAEKLACSALAEDPHEEIIQEMRHVLEAIYFQPDDPAEAASVLTALHGAIDAAVAEGKAAPVTYSETYADVDYDPARPGFIVGIGDEEETEGYEVLVRRTYGRGRRVEDNDGK